MENICQRCKANPIHIYDSGKNCGLCKPCIDDNCLGCGQRPMHVFSDGAKCGLCAECIARELSERMGTNT